MYSCLLRHNNPKGTGLISQFPNQGRIIFLRANWYSISISSVGYLSMDMHDIDTLRHHSDSCNLQIRVMGGVSTSGICNT